MAEVTLHGSTALSVSSPSQPSGVVSETDACAWDCTATGVSLLGVRIFVGGNLAAVGATVTLGVLQPGVDTTALGSSTPAASGTVTLAAGWNEVRFGSPVALSVGRFETFVRSAGAADTPWRFTASDATNRPIAGVAVGTSGVSLTSTTADSAKVPTQRRQRASSTDGSTWTTSTLNDVPLDVILSVPDSVAGIAATLSITPASLAGAVVQPAPASVSAGMSPAAVSLAGAVATAAAGSVTATIAPAVVALAGAVTTVSGVAVAAGLSPASVALAGAVSVASGGPAFGRVVATISRLVGQDGHLVGLTSGWVTLEALTASVRVAGSLVVADRIRCRITAGALHGPDGAVGVTVLATDQPGASPALVQYRATWDLDGVRSQPPAAIFEVPTGGTVDLAIVVPATPQPGVERVVVDPQAVIDAAVVEATTAAEGAAQAVVLELDPVLTVNGFRPDSAGNVEVTTGGGAGTVTSVNHVTPDDSGNVTLPASATGVDSHGLPSPRVERYDLVVQGALAVGSLTTLINLPGGRLRRVTSRSTSSSGNAVAYHQVTIAGTGIYTAPKYVGWAADVDIPVVEGSSLGVQVTSVTGTGSVVDLVVSVWVVVGA